VASNFVAQELSKIADYSQIMSDTLEFNLPDSSFIFSDYHTSENYSIITSISLDELEWWKTVYKADQTTSWVLKDDDNNKDSDDTYSQYQVGENGLIYFEDWNRNHHLVVPATLQVEITSEIHNTITEAAHGGYAKTYNCIAAIYYWPIMSWDIKKYIGTCNICQKAKLRHHVPVRMLQTIPIPSQPFEVVSMDFIPELPVSNGYNNILVIVDKLTKYALFIPTTTTITKKGTAKLFFHHVIAQYGIPWQVISDWDTQ